MISDKLVLKNAPRVIGEQIHINHEDCEAGEDTKKRLYIKRVDNGVVAYCHNCQGKRFIRDNITKKDRLTKVFDTPEILPGKLPENISEKIVDTVSPQGQIWLWKYGFECPDTNFKGIKDKPDQVALRLLDTNADTIGWQVRNLDGKPPKYITKFFNTERGNNAWFTRASKVLVITEDYLSAYKISVYTIYDTLALLSTNLSDSVLKNILDIGYTHVILWLDPDEAGVEGTKKAAKKLSYFLPETTKIRIVKEDKEDKEAKECGPVAINAIITKELIS